MHPAIKKQNDSKAKFRKASIDSALDCTNSRDMARQEFATEADINTILKRFGIDPMQQRPVQWGMEIDYNLDLQQAMQAIKDSQNAYNRLAPEVKDKYPTWDQFSIAMQTGVLADELEKAGKKYHDDNQRPIVQTVQTVPPMDPKTVEVPKVTP